MRGVRLASIARTPDQQELLIEVLEQRCEEYRQLTGAPAAPWPCAAQLLAASALLQAPCFRRGFLPAAPQRSSARCC